jgi:plastocyanin
VIKKKLDLERSKQKLIIVALIAVTLTLGYLIFKQNNPSSKGANFQNIHPSNQQIEAILPPGNMSTDEQDLLHPPSESSSTDLKQKHMALVIKLAKPGSSIELSDCKPTPLVLQIKQGTNLEVKNNDTVKHTLVFDNQHSLNIEPNSKATINVNFQYGTGDYGYVCQGLGLVGFLHIIP